MLRGLPKVILKKKQSQNWNTICLQSFKYMLLYRKGGKLWGNGVEKHWGTLALSDQNKRTGIDIATEVGGTTQNVTKQT